jgi:putative FmdB family regulatory protein
MPTYDYECRNCKHSFEEYQSITSAPLKKCPVCGKNTLHRLIGCGAGVIFKGSGFYCNDYRSKTYLEKAKTDKGPDTSAKPEKPATPAKPSTPSPKDN